MGCEGHEGGRLGSAWASSPSPKSKVPIVTGITADAAEGEPYA